MLLPSFSTRTNPFSSSRDRKESTVVFDKFLFLGNRSSISVLVMGLSAFHRIIISSSSEFGSVLYAIFPSRIIYSAFAVFLSIFYTCRIQKSRKNRKRAATTLFLSCIHCGKKNAAILSARLPRKTAPPFPVPYGFRSLSRYC